LEQGNPALNIFECFKSYKVEKINIFSLVEWWNYPFKIWKTPSGFWGLKIRWVSRILPHERFVR